MDLTYVLTEELTIDVCNSRGTKIGTIKQNSSYSSSNKLIFTSAGGLSSTVGLVILEKTIEESKKKLEEELTKIIEFAKLLS